MITSHSIKQTYNRFSSLYDLIFKPFLDFGRERAIKLLAPKYGARVLEIGVGTGLNLEYYPPGIEVLGFDYLLGAYVLTVVSDPDKAVRELFRVARPGAKVVLINYIRSSNKLLGLIEDIFHPVFSSIGLFTLDYDLPGLLKQHGAKDIRIEPTSILNLHFIVSFTVPA